jgi:hypothetical protein
MQVILLLDALTVKAMFIDSNDFERWMRRIMERFDSLESLLEKPDDEQKKAPTVDGEKLFDNQDICFMFHICKRTLQRYRTLGWLPYLKIDQKAYYKESDVKKFIEERAEKKKRPPD